MARSAKPPPMPFLSRTLADPAATTRFAAALAPFLRAGDVVALSGALGMGKSAIARTIIQTRAGVALDVPSPTFTLVQPYDDLPGGPVWHCDLYRLSAPDEVEELGLDAAEDAIMLIEWPDRLGTRLPRAALHLDLEPWGDGRRVALRGVDPWPARLAGLA